MNFTQADIQAALFYYLCERDEDFIAPENNDQQEVYARGESLIAYPDNDDQPFFFLCIVRGPIDDRARYIKDDVMYTLVKEGDPIIGHPSLEVIG